MKALAKNDKVYQLEDAIRTLDTQVHLEPEHYFGGGVYVRELRIPAGVVATGKMHRHESMNILVSGTLRVMSDHGHDELTGPHIFTSPPMTKKAVYAVTDVIILNAHPAEHTDLQALEDELIFDDGRALT